MLEGIRDIGLLPCIRIIREPYQPLRVFVLESGGFTAESVVRHVQRILEYSTDSDWTFWVKNNPAHYVFDRENRVLRPSTGTEPGARRYWELEKCSIYDQ